MLNSTIKTGANTSSPSRRPPAGKDHFAAAPLQGTVVSALIYTLGGLGDALLYPVLPLMGPELGLTALWIGVLLSINKYIRILANSLVAYWTARQGYRIMMLGAGVLATLSTLSYGLAAGLLWLWVLSRLLWGFSFATFRIGALGYATEAAQPGFSLGLSRAIQEIGPLLILWLGPWLLWQIGFSYTFVAIGVLTAMVIPLSLKLPKTALVPQRLSLRKMLRPGRLDLWVFGSAFATEGVLIVTLSLLLTGLLNSPEKVVGTTALYLLLRRLSMLLLGPLVGLMADQWQLQKLFGFSALALSLSLRLIGLGYVEAGVMLAFAASSLNSAFVPAIALQKTAGMHKLQVLSTLATSRDVGAATGMLLGIVLFHYLTATPLYLGLALFTSLLYVAMYGFNSSHTAEVLKQESEG